MVTSANRRKASAGQSLRTFSEITVVLYCYEKEASVHLNDIRFELGTKRNHYVHKNNLLPYSSVLKDMHFQAHQRRCLTMHSNNNWNTSDHND